MFKQVKCRSIISYECKRAYNDEHVALNDLLVFDKATARVINETITYVPMCIYADG